MANKRGLPEHQKLTKTERDACEFNSFGVWGWKHPEAHPDEEYEPSTFVLKPVSPNHWHGLKKFTTPEQHQRAERNRLQALERLYENGYIGYEEKQMRRNKGEIF